MCSYAVKSELARLAFVVLSVVICGAAEEMLPKIAGVGLPLLFAFAVYCGTKFRLVEGFFAVLTAGAMEEALCSLPFATSIVFFVMAAAIARWYLSSIVMMSVMYAVYQLWLCGWTGCLDGGVPVRFLSALPSGALAAWIAGWSADRLTRKAGIGV